MMCDSVNDCGDASDEYDSLCCKRIPYFTYLLNVKTLLADRIVHLLSTAYLLACFVFCCCFFYIFMNC